MNRKLPRLILILLIVALAVALLACSPSGETPGDNNGSSNSSGDTIGGGDSPTQSETINKATIFGEIENGLINAGKRIDATTNGIRYVDSKYTLVATVETETINIGIEYQANYDLARAQDSEIMVRIFDYVNEANTMFVYYHLNDLYLQVGEEYMKMEDFGGTSTFKLFYEAVTILDMEQTLFSVDFASNIKSMSGSVDSQNIKKIILSDNEYNVSVNEINLDPAKTAVNNFLEKNVGKTFGNRLDALTQKFLGFKLSSLGKVRIGRFNADMLTVFETMPNGEPSITDFNIQFAGNQTNNIDTYSLDVKYSTSYTRGEIKLTKFDNPENNNYVSKNVSAMHFVGNLYVPHFDKTFDAEIQGNFSTTDNAVNEVFVDIVDRTENQGDFAYAVNERVFGAMYKNGVTYVDSKGLFESYLGDFLSYNKLGLPRVKFHGLNMTEELQILLEKGMSLLQFDFDLGGLLGKNEDNSGVEGEEEKYLYDNASLMLYLSKIRSENGVFYITIDNELVNQILGDSDASIVSVLAESLGLEEGLIKDIIELGYFDDLALEIAWNTANNGLAITAKTGLTDIFVMSLNSVGVGDEGLDIAFPDREETGYFDTFEEFDNPEIINVHVEGTIRTQGKEKNDISKLIGLFIGDISGNNTEYALTVKDTLYLSMDLWQKGNDYFVNAKVTFNGNDFIDICSNVANPEELLINNYELGVKYILPRQTVIDQIGELTQNKAVWEFETIVNALELLAAEAQIDLGEHMDANKDGICDKCGKTLAHVDMDNNGTCDDCGGKYVVSPDYISMIISPSYDAKTGNKTSDPLFEILGVEDFIAELKVNIDFDEPSDLVDATGYVVPVVNLIEEERWISRYEVRWVEYANISFANSSKEFKLTFDPESVDFTNGVYEYYPRAELFGQTITYRMFITDLVNGTKKVKSLYDPQNSVYLMEIDPSLENPIPEKIAVTYEDDSIGYLAYEFVGFPYNNDNIASLMGGQKKTAYKVVLGKGSITEQEFPLEIVVKGRNFVVNAGDYYNNVPIVARVTIDPYQYSIEKREADSRNESYYPFKYDNVEGNISRDTLILSFYDYTKSDGDKTSSPIRKEYYPCFDWGFNEDLITFAGGEFTKVQKFNTLEIAIEIVVQVKKVKHIQINSEEPGYYTIDSLVTSTYTIPTITEYDEEGKIVKDEIRIYFASGHYRIIGAEPENYVKKDPLCDGFYNEALDWSIKVADNVTVDRSTHPLNNGKTKYTECVFGDDVVGKQNVVLEVVCPTRTIQERALTTFAVTYVEYLADGVTINTNAIVREGVKVSLASFTKDGNVNTNYFEFNPYDLNTAEDLTNDWNKNGVWDDAEEFIDANDNGVWDDAEEFDDVNGNGVWDDAETFVDSNENGQYDEGEDFDDVNGNGVWDKAESFNDVNGNGIWDDAEVLFDTNGDGVWNDEDKYVDFNGNGQWDERKTLPFMVYVNVVYQGKEQIIGYPVTWIIENNMLEETSCGTIVKNVFAEETYMQVRGIIGDGEITQTLTMVIHNHAVGYRNVKFFNLVDTEGGKLEKEIQAEIRRYDEVGNLIPEGSDEQEVSRKYFITGLNPYEEYQLPERVTLQFPEFTGMGDRMFDATWYFKDANGNPVVDASGNCVNAQGYFVNIKDGESLVTVYADVRSMTDTSGVLEQTVELNLVYDLNKKVNPNRIYGLASIDGFDMAVTETIHYLIIDSYDEISQKLYDDLTVDGGIKKIDIAFMGDGSSASEERTYGNSIDITWINLDEFLAVMQSPFGSSSFYNEGKYPNEIIFLEGTIRKDIPGQSQNIKMGFMIMPRVLGNINFGNFDKNLSAKDENNVSAVTIATEIQEVKGETQVVDGKTVPVYNENGYQAINVAGKNAINVRFNKYFSLSNNDGLCSPEEYVRYLFNNVSLSFGDTVKYSDLEYELPENFNDLIYGNVKTTTDPNVTITETEVIFRFEIKKLSLGSCIQTFTVTLTFLKDRTVVGVNDAFIEEIEVFNTDGTVIYGNNEGFVLENSFVVEYVYSGSVTYTNLVWKADETATSNITDAIIGQDDPVTNVKHDFFNFTSTRIIKLYTTLPNGQKFRRHLTFYGKNVNLSKYHTEEEGLYKVVNGTIAIENVYDYLPLENLLNNLPTAIVPDNTAAYISKEDISFTLMEDWKPSENFASSSDEYTFDITKIKESITSAGLSSTLFATNKIMGYNGETQTIRLYVSVKDLTAGQISHEKYNIVGNNLVYDQYVYGVRDNASANAQQTISRFVLPKDIKVDFGDVEYQFSDTDDVRYQIRHTDRVTYSDIEEIPFNNKGNTLSSEYGYEANDEIYIKVILPDGNDRLRIVVTFPNRVLKEVKYASKTSENNSVLVSGRYYIDPYDRSTFKLPTTAMFKYQEESDFLSQEVKWTAKGENLPFTCDANGDYTYNGGEYNGKSYLFTSSLRSFDANDDTQNFIMQVFVLNRTLTKPQNYPEVFKVENQLKKGSATEYLTPFEMGVQDLPSTLSAEDFHDLSGVQTINDTERTALNSLVNTLKITKNTVTYYDVYKDGVSIYDSAFVAAYNPVVPNVLWKIEKDGEKVELVNDDILVNGGFKYTIYGCIGNGAGEDRTYGQEIVMTLEADTWVFNKVDSIVNNVVEFNHFTLVSILTQFDVSFIVTNEDGKTTNKTIVFYPEYYVDNLEKEKAVIVWNKEDLKDNSKTGSITFKNTNKLLAINAITTDEIYKFDTQQVGIDELNFGFGVGYAKDGEVDLVIDPLNPVIPTTALARGKLILDKQTEIYLGEVNVDWDIDDATNPDSIYYLNMDGATKKVYCTVSSGVDSDTAFKFAVNVTYLNRAPVSILTTESGYTNVAKEGLYYPLMSTIIRDNKPVKYYTFVVDPTPTDDRLFSLNGDTNVKYVLSEGGYATSNYTLPSTLRLIFDNSYDVDSIGSEGLQKFGAEVTLTDVEWIISRDIGLVGTSVQGSNIVAKIRSFRVQYVSEGVTHTSGLYSFEDDAHLGSYLTLSLQTINRQVEYTYVVKNGENAVLSETPEGSVENYQQARDEFFIDPYNIAFPEDVYVIFTGSTIPFHASNVEWKYDEDLLKKVNIITGSIGAEYMLIMASMTVYGTTLQVQFPIRARNIPVSVEVGEDGKTTMDPLEAGTIYVLAGIPAEQQLPTYLYYRFDYSESGGGFSEIARVPLSFPATSVSKIQTDQAGRVYSNVKAKLGLVDDDNVLFTIKVIDPKLYALRSTVQNSIIGSVAPAQAYVNGGFIYDYIPIGINAANQYVPGPETNILPDRVIISESGEYMEIVNIDYDVENLIATVQCRYTFLSFNDSPELSGDKDPTSENSDKMFLTFQVPIKTYSYNWLEEQEATFENTTFSFELGTIVTASDLPLTTSGVAPIWDLDGLNQNRAGEYKATCYYKNAYGNIVTGEITIIIKRRSITKEDFTWVEVDDVNFRKRDYNGGEELNVKDYIEIGEFLREDGSYGPLNYTVVYSIDGEKTWQTTQPTQVKEFEDSPTYRVRIMVTSTDDYNYTGTLTYDMEISKRIINEEDIYFYSETDPLGNHIPIEESEYKYTDKNGANATMQMKQVSYEYTGVERIPMLGGIPRGATTNIEYALFDPNASQQPYAESTRPISVGTYIMRAQFTADQRNYNIGSNVYFTILIHITKKQVVYKMAQSVEYTGEFFHVPIEGLPANLGENMSVTYSYKNVITNETIAPNSMIKDAGTYHVIVTINGGRDYPDAVLENEFTINKRKVILNVNTVSSEYLDPLKPLDSALTLSYALNPNEPGLVGKYDTSLKLVFGDIAVAWTGGELTYKHMVGSYPLVVVNKANMLSKGGDEEKTDGFSRNYEFVAINDGNYNIVAERENTRIIQSKDQLTKELQQLKEGDSVIWYFLAGDYGTITIDVNASVSIIGSYDLTTEEEIITVSFDQIIVEKGAVLIDIVAFNDLSNDASVRVGKNASSLTVSRSKFIRGGSNVLTNSKAISTEEGYKNTVYVSETYFMGYSTAIYMLDGSLELRRSELYQNMNGVYLQRGSIILDTNKFIANRGVAMNIVSSKATTSIFDNLFENNDTAIKTAVALRNDIRVQNVFAQNTITFDGWTEEE